MDHLLPRRVGSGDRISFGRIAWRILRILYRALEHSRQRRALTLLSDEGLRDIGLTRFDVAREVAKPFWRR